MDEDLSFQFNYQEGLSKFQSMRGRAFWGEVLSLFRGKSTELLSFDEIRTRLRLKEESYRGLQDIPLDQIVGSVGRYKDFTKDFLPRSSELQERWSRVYAKAHSDVGLPPIEVYKVGHVYFVRDGNHRVSVARQLHQETIQAHVTELPTHIELNADMTEADIDLASAYALFLEETGLRFSRPNPVSMLLSEPSRYPEMLGHIYLHGQVMEQILGHAVTAEQASADWYDIIYRPAITLIRKYEILKHLNSSKERTEADVYLWMVDHLQDFRKELNHEHTDPRFSHALVEFLKERQIKVPESLEEEKDDKLVLTRSQAMRLRDEERVAIQKNIQKKREFRNE
ncbi:hypothetical protein MASR2M15_21020 [Anaerolineales bacterium]